MRVRNIQPVTVPKCIQQLFVLKEVLDGTDRDSLFQTRTRDQSMKTCPKCGLISPDSALRCDCRFIFPVGSKPAAVGPTAAGFGVRLGAALIDFVIISLVLYLLELLLGQNLVWAIISGLSYWAYFALAESGEHRGTLAKRFLSLEVTDLDGKPLSLAKATGRLCCRFITCCAMCGFGMFSIPFSSKGQAFHDWASESVVRVRARI